MFTNFTEETCTGTGATLALAGATTGMIPFSESFADGDLVDYALTDSGGSIKITGVGTYVAATDDITRGDIWNYNGTVVDTSPASNITLSGGTHTIVCAAVAHDMPSSLDSVLNSRADTPYLVDIYNRGATSTRSGTINRVFLTCFVVAGPVTLSGLGISVTTLATTGTNLHLGLYRINSDNSFSQVATTGVIDVSSGTGTTGYNTSNFTTGNININPSDVHFLALGSDSDAAYSGLNINRGGNPYMPQRYDVTGAGAFFDNEYSSGLPTTTGTADHNNVQTGGVYPIVFGVIA